MPKQRLLLVGWDGADWSIARPLMEAGHMPALKRAVDRGVSGPLASIPPYMSPMLWNSMATGCWPHRHGILGFSERDPSSGKVRASSSANRRLPAFWNILSQRRLRNHVVGWFASHPAEVIDGICISEAWVRPPQSIGQPWPLLNGGIYPPESAESFAGCRVRPEEVDLGLLGLFFPHVSEMNLEQDPRVESLLYRLAELYTAHNAAIRILMEDEESSQDWRLMAVYYHFIDWIGHEFMEFRPPRHGTVLDRDVRLYGAVVDAAYRLQDILLNDLLAHAGAETTLMLVSDHGFQSGTARPAATPGIIAGTANWHRPHGIAVVSGPNTVPGGKLEGAHLLDVCPTVLHLLGLPVGSNMDGRAWAEAEIVRRIPTEIPAWDAECPANSASVVDEQDQADLLQQFIDLGYLKPDNSVSDPLGETTDRENDFNLGVALIAAGLPAQAVEPLYRAAALLPEQPHLGYQLAMALGACGKVDEAIMALEPLLDFGDDHPMVRNLVAQLSITMGRLDLAERILHDNKSTEELLAIDATSNHELLLRGVADLNRGHFESALERFGTVLERNPDHPEAWLGRARALLRMDRIEDAEIAARKALDLHRELPLAHLTMAQCAIRREATEEAVLAAAEALRFEPNLSNSRDLLIRHFPELPDALRAQVLERLRMAPRSQSFGGRDPLIAEAGLLAAREFVSQRRRSHRASALPIHQFDTPTPKLPGTSGQLHLVVSGLPRSGTSMLMQMLVAGGLEPMTDTTRLPDVDNPRGYFEWDSIKDLDRNPDLMDQVGQRVIKILVPLVKHLPREHRYKVLFMRRPIVEVVASQTRMLERLEKSGANQDETTLERGLKWMEESVLKRLRQQPEIELIELDYLEILERPVAIVERIRQAVGPDRLPHADAMVNSIEPSLRRQRRSP